jgi:hypothetical protein
MWFLAEELFGLGVFSGPRLRDILQEALAVKPAALRLSDLVSYRWLKIGQARLPFVDFGIVDVDESIG